MRINIIKKIVDYIKNLLLSKEVKALFKELLFTIVMDVVNQVFHEKKGNLSNQ